MAAQAGSEGALAIALPCFGRIFTDLMAEDGLLVMGRGLGLRVVLCRFIMQYLTSRRPVLVVNLDGGEVGVVLDMLEAGGVLRSQLPLRLGANTNAAERRRAYERGGVMFTSSQTMLVDMLAGAGRLDARLVEGILVAQAHDINENSTPGFAIRHLKHSNPGAFVKAFSEHPDHLTSGFNRTEKTLRALFVPKLYLWPRFQSRLMADITAVPSDMVERSCAMTPSMVAVQRAIVDCMDAALNALKSCTRIDTDAVTVERALFDTFDDLIRRQLGSNENTLKPKARTALADLKTLRKLATYLLRYDAVTYCTFLDTLRMSSMQFGRAGDWLNSEAGARVYKAARDRMFTVMELTGEDKRAGMTGRATKPGAPVILPPPKLGMDAMAGREPLLVAERIDTSGGMGAGVPSSLGFTPTRQHALHIGLEHNPKWAQLALVMDEIRAACAHVQAAACAGAGAGAASSAAPGITDPLQSGARILVAVKDEHTAHQLRKVLERGPDAVLRENFCRYLTKNAIRTRALRQRVRAMYPAVGSAGEEGSAPSGAWHSTTEFRDAPEDVRDLLIAADAPGMKPPSAGGSGTAGAAGGPAKVAEVFVPIDQRLLWKETAREICHTQVSNAASHAAVVAHYREMLRLVEKGGDAVEVLEEGDEGVEGGGDVAEAMAGKEAVANLLVKAAGSGRRKSPAGKARGAQRGLAASPGGTVSLKRRRTDAGNVAGGGGGAGPEVAGEGEEVIELLDEDEEEVEEVQDEGAHPEAAGGGKGPTIRLVSRNQVLIYPLSRMDSRYSLLADTAPNFVILYDLDATFIREVEMYIATIAPRPFRVYSLSYTASAEESKFMRAIEDEHRAFEKLIEEKAHLAVSGPRTTAAEAAAYVAPDSALVVRRGAEGGQDAWGMDMRPGGVDPRSMGAGIAGALSLLTGGAGGRSAAAAAAAAAVRPSVIMDMRELRSKLPSLLDQAGVEIVPVTLEVGDYVISPDIVIERKSVPDLIGSLNSGRLYNQAEAMARHYKTPALLVEFDADRPFALADNTELPAEIDARDVRSKLVLLLLHFPSLRLIWSRSPHVTVNLFKELKKGRPEPDRETAALVGTETEGGGAGGKAEGEGDAATRNLAAIDLLRKLPGVTVGNYKSIMAAVPTLAALAVTPQAELSRVIGKPNASLLYEFLHNRKAAALL